MPQVTTTSLHMRSVDELRPSRATLPAGCRIERVDAITPEFSKFLYRSVGSGWNWADRLPLTRREWADIITRPGSETWVLWTNGAPAGYLELAGSPEGVVEIVYFGLFPEQLGRGFGGLLLAEGTARAWDLHTRWQGFAPVHRVWVHTCSLDGPAALANYRARGFEVFAVEEADQAVVDASTGWWPEA
ncbi:GNAT family N-acetyltransferase [Arthrobacter sp.]|uniref:GNAT family N-acetyltransferase n=1 Tax=Arthrobacter sp. TaxID=1667 RepID=UPI003A92E9D1